MHLKNIGRNKKITLTMNQLKRLVKESEENGTAGEIEQVKEFVEKFTKSIVESFNYELDNIDAEDDDEQTQTIMAIYSVLSEMSNAFYNGGFYCMGREDSLNNILEQWRKSEVPY